MGKATELLLDRPGMREAKSRARYALEGFIFHWKAPIQNSLTPSLNGYLSGLEIGDTESAGWNRKFAVPAFQSFLNACLLRVLQSAFVAASRTSRGDPSWI